jgi:hypothetical protein
VQLSNKLLLFLSFFFFLGGGGGGGGGGGCVGGVPFILKLWFKLVDENLFKHSII